MNHHDACVQCAKNSKNVNYNRIHLKFDSEYVGIYGLSSRLAIAWVLCFCPCLLTIVWPGTHMMITHKKKRTRMPSGMWTYFSSRQWFDWPSTAEIVFPSPIAYSDSQVLCPSAAKHTSKYINPNHKKIKQTFQADDSHRTLQQCTFLLQGPCVYPIFMPTLTGPWHNFSERVCLCAQLIDWLIKHVPVCVSLVSTAL